MKKCNNCGVEKELDDFRMKDGGLLNKCKMCEREYCVEYRKENQEKFKKYYEDNKEYILIKSKKYREDNKEYFLEYNKKYFHENREYFNKKKKEYNSSERGKETKRKWCNEYNKENPHIVTWRTLLQNTIKQLCSVKKGHTKDELGFSANDLKIFMETKFTTGMTWENHGEWHIDHIKPVSSFDKDTPPSVVCALDNLQPLWATTREIDGIIYEGNLNKGNYYE